MNEHERGELLVYQSPDGEIKLDVRLQDETVWLTQAMMAELFQTTPQNITIHLKGIYEEGELSEPATRRDFLQVQLEGGRTVLRQRKFYNLEAVISVGYRVKSAVATRFCIWATQRLREYIVKGFAMDDELLKQSGTSSRFTASRIMPLFRRDAPGSESFTIASYPRVNSRFATVVSESTGFNPKSQEDLYCKIEI